MEIIHIAKHALMISFFVFVMMLLIDFIEAAGGGRVYGLIRGGLWRQYILTSFLGATPGCLGAFMNVAFYLRGMISFGAIVGGMIATSGDEAFVMLTQFPGTATLLFGLLCLSGIFFAWVTDKIIPFFGIVPSESCLEVHCDDCLPGGKRKGKGRISNICETENIISNFKKLSFTRFLFIVLVVSFLILFVTGILGPPEWSWKRVTFISLSVCILCIITICSEHYLENHIWQHIIKAHLFRVFLWSFGALLFLHWGLAFWDMEGFVYENMFWVLLIAALLGIIPESGPHLIFVMMFSQGLIPFSVLFTASFVQDGHGMLPLLSHSLKDSVFIKAFNLLFGLGIGVAIYSIGL